MTQEAIAKLAKKLELAANQRICNMLGTPTTFADNFLPILTAHLAAREEEYARLREAAAEALDLLEKTWTGDYQKPNIVRRLRERLTPQQEPGK